MDATAVALQNQSKRNELVRFLDTQSLKDLSDSIENCLWASTPYDDVDPLVFVQAILNGSPPGSEEATARRFTLLKAIIAWLCQNPPPSTTTATNLINTLLPELETLDTAMLYEASLQIVAGFLEHKVVHPRLFELLVKSWNIVSMKNAERDKVQDILSRLCDHDWHPQVAVALASAFNDMELTTPQLELVAKRLIRQLAHLDVEETPPFVYQILLLSRKGYKRAILSGICESFGTSRLQDTRMEGTVMLHMSFAIKQDQELGNELVKYARSNKMYLYETFIVACLLSVVRIHRLEEPVFDLLKGSIISIYKDNEKIKKCAWLSDYVQTDQDIVRSVMLDIANKSANGWDQVIQPLAQLAMLLIDTACSQAGWPRTSTAAKKANGNNDGPMDKVAALGVDVLVRMFQLHDPIRAEVLEQITSRIISRSPAATSFLDLLQRIVSTCPQATEPYLANIKDTLDYLSFLPHSTAEQLLDAIHPITINDDAFRDGLVLVLRKSMFAKDLDGRKVSVHGFLRLLNSQIKIAEQGESNAQAAQGVVFEILGILRRCFSQQAEIRAIAYERLGQLSGSSSLIASEIFEVLDAQFKKIYEKDATIPFRLDACVENALTGGYPRTSEPVHILLANLFKAVRQLSDCDQPVIKEVLDRRREDIDSLIFRLSKADLEDYELDKTANYDMATHLGLRNYLYAVLLHGSYEAAIEHEYYIRGNTFESFQTILNLFKKREALVSLLKESVTNEKGRKISIASHIPCALSMGFITSVVQSMFMQGNIQTPSRALRSDIGFVHYIVGSVPASLKVALEKEDDNEQETFTNCIELAKVLMCILLTEDSDSGFLNHGSKKGPSAITAIIESLRHLLETAAERWPDKIHLCLRKLLGAASRAAVPDDMFQNTVILKTLFYFKDILNKYLGDRTPFYKEAASVVHIIAFLAKKLLDRKGVDFDECAQDIVRWLDRFAKDRPIQDVTLARELLSLHICLCAEIADFMSITYIAQDIHNLYGDLEGPSDSQVEEQQPPRLQYSMVNEKTCAAITTLLLAFLDQSFEDLVWAVTRLKVHATSGVDTDSLLEFEIQICKRTCSYLSITSELTRSILTSVHAETLIKVLTKTYKALLALVKYKLGRPRNIPQDFVSVIRLAGTAVTDKMYKFLTVYGQQYEELESSGTRKKKGKSKLQSEGAQTKEKAKILRESKMIPNLIFVVEQFERHLIQLTRKSKVDLMQYMKRSTARDFKIKLEYIRESESLDDSNAEEDSSLNKRHPATDDDSDSASKRQRN